MIRDPARAPACAHGICCHLARPLACAPGTPVERYRTSTSSRVRICVRPLPHYPAALLRSAARKPSLTSQHIGNSDVLWKLAAGRGLGAFRGSIRAPPRARALCAVARARLFRAMIRIFRKTHAAHLSHAGFGTGKTSRFAIFPLVSGASVALIASRSHITFCLMAVCDFLTRACHSR